MKKKESLDRLIAWAVFLVLGAIYWRNRSASFGAGDSPQHVLSALTYGVSWPPGYPLYNALAHLFSRLPLGAPESLVDGFSGLCHAAAAAVFYLLLRRQKLEPGPALTGVAFMAFSPLFWYYSEVAEVRALNDLLAVSAAYFAFAWAQDRKASALYFLAAVLGFGISHHPTYVLILPALAYLLWRHRVHEYNRAALGAAAVLAISACAAPYITLGIRLHISSPVYNPMGVTTWADVLNLFLRKNLGGPLRMVGGRGFFDLGGLAVEPILAQARWLAHSLWAEPGAVGAGLAALGAAYLWKKQRPMLAFWALWTPLSLAIFLFISSQQLHLHDPDYARAIAVRFYLMPFFGLFACAAFGAQWAAERTRRAAGWALAVAATMAFFIHPIDLRGHDPLLDYGRDIIRSASDENSVVILAADDTVLVENYLDYIKHETGDRVFLNPVLFSFPRYRAELEARYPKLVLPPSGPGGLPMDWNLWMRLNPDRPFYSEVMFLRILERDVKPLAPCGVLIAMNYMPPVCSNPLQYFSLTKLKMSDIHPFTQELYLARTASLYLAWYASRVEPKGNEAYLAEIEARLSALQ